MKWRERAPASERVGGFAGTEPPEAEIERYELSEPPRFRFELERRDFLRVLTAMGGGLLVVASLPGSAQDGESGRGGRGGAQASGDLTSWLHIDDRGRVTAFTGKVEIGQNIRTSLTQTVADELRVPPGAVTFVMADTDLAPFDQGTFGSRTTPMMAPLLARAAATARDLLLARAADTWNVPRETLTGSGGTISARDGRSIGYGELVKTNPLTGAVEARPDESARDQWAIRGTSLKKIDGRDFVTGRHDYTADLKREGLLIGRVVRPAAIGAIPTSVDDVAARAMAGVTVVRDGDFIGVTAPDERKVAAAAAAVKVEWRAPTGLPTSETIYEHLKRTAGAAPIPAATPPNEGRVFRASYRIPYIAHVPPEPRSAVAEWTGDKLTVWAATQRPFGVRSELAQAFRIPEGRVRVIVPDMGSGYGGKHTGDVAVEAARLARAAGRPVKIVYTRAEEFMWAYFRPAGVIDIDARIDATGRLASWEFHNYNSGGSGLRTPYAVPDRREQFHQSDSPLRQGSYRGLAATANHHAREMHMDAIARALGVDAVEFRLTHLEDSRLRDVLVKAAETIGWPRASQPGRSLGIACGVEKGAYVATAVEASRMPDGFRLERVVGVFECGAIVNPDGLANQVEGSLVQGLGGALFEIVRFADGRILNGTLAQYRVPRFKDVPPIEVVLLDRKDLPSAGAGETAIVAIAPAIGSAVRAFGEVDTALPVTLRA